MTAFLFHSVIKPLFLNIWPVYWLLFFSSCFTRSKYLLVSPGLAIAWPGGIVSCVKGRKARYPLFIFDRSILDQLEDKKDRRVEFIHNAICEMDKELQSLGSSMLVKIWCPVEVFSGLLKEYKIDSVFTNHDYEPYALERDEVQNFIG